MRAASLEPVADSETGLCDDFGSSQSGRKLFGAARVEDGVLKLLTPANGSYGIAYLRDVTGGFRVKSFRVTFKAALFGGPTGPGNGFSFNLVPVATLRSVPSAEQPAEEGLEEGLSVGFDTRGDQVADGPAIEVKWLGEMVARTPVQVSQSPAATTAADAWREVVIELGADGLLNVSYGGSNVLVNVPTGYRAAAIGAPAWVLGARVGGFPENYWFDNWCVTAVLDESRPIPGLFNSGIGTNGLVLADNQPDPHYRLLPAPPAVPAGSAPVTVTSSGGFPVPPWLPDRRTSAWISEAPDAVMIGGVRTYQTTFNLARHDLATVKIFGRWAADDQGLGILLNGVPLSVPVANGPGSWTPFEISGGFVDGTNTLRFSVQNRFDVSQPSGRNVAGLRVELWGSAELSAVPCIPVVPPRLFIRQIGSEVEVRWQGGDFLLYGGPAYNLRSFVGRGTTVDGLNYTARFPIQDQFYYQLRRPPCN